MLPWLCSVHNYIIIIILSRVYNEQFNNLLPVGLLAQLVELCTGIAEVKGSNPVQAGSFFHVFFSQPQKLPL